MPSGFWAYFIKQPIPRRRQACFSRRAQFTRVPAPKTSLACRRGNIFFSQKCIPSVAVAMWQGGLRRHRRPPWGVAAAPGEEREEEIQAEDLFVCFPRRFSTATYSARMAGARRRARAKEAPAAIWVAKRRRPCRPPCRCGKTRPRGRPWRQSPGNRKDPADP